MRLKPIIYFLLFNGILIFRVSGQDNTALSLDDCIQVGLSKSKVLMISKTKMDFSKAKTDEASAGQYPSLKFNGGYTRFSPLDPPNLAFTFAGQTIYLGGMFPIILNNYNLKLTAMQPIFTGNRLSANYELNRNNELASKEDFNTDRNQLVLDIKTAYWNVFKAMEFKKVVDENINQINCHLADVQNLYMRGLAVNNDVMKVQVQLANTKVLQIDANNNIKFALMALNNSMGIPVNANTAIDAKPESKNYDLPAVQDLVKQAISTRSELKSMDYRIKGFESMVTIAKSSYYPQINLVGNYNYQRPNSRIFPTRDKFMGTWDVSILMTYDIWNWQTASYQTAQAEATLEQTRTSLNQIKDVIELEVSSNYLNVTKCKEKITVSADAVKQAEENNRVVTEKYKNGLAINSDVIDAESALLQAKINLTSAIADYEIAIAKLEKSINK